MTVTLLASATGGLVSDVVSDEETRAELARVLASKEFKASPRRREMLRYLMAEIAAGRGQKLKGYTVGVAVFGRGADFDAQADPVVRLEARRLRRDLAGYYVSEGRFNPLRISIPKGGYAPEIVRAEGLPAVPAPNTRAEAPEPPPVSPAVASSAFRRPPAALVWLLVAAAVILLPLLGYMYSESTRQRDAAASAAEGPAIIVWPFTVLGERQRDRYLAAGMTDQIITELSRFSDFRLFLPTVEVRQDPSDDPLTASERLGIPFVVTGTIASDASNLRIGSRLIEVASGRVLWSEEFERPAAAESLLSTQADIASAIASTLGQPYGVIQSQITNRLPDGDAPAMSSYECVLRAYAYRRSFDDNFRGPVLSCLEAAVRRDPKYAEAWAMLGWLYMDEGRFDLQAGDARNEAYDRGFEAASHAVSLDARNVLALKALASINHYKGNFDEAERLQRQALALNPNDPDTLAQLGWRLAARGNFAEGIPYLQRAIERTVNPPGWYFHLIAVDHYLHGRYAEMLDSARRGTVDNSGISWSFVAIAHGALGDRTEARDALDKMARIAPRLAADPAAVYKGHGAVDSVVSALVAGLRNAGWVGQPAG